MQKTGLLIFALISTFMVVGCQQAEMFYPSDEYSVAGETISIHRLAGRLGMQVQYSTNGEALLTNSRDKITLFTDAGGSFYVNDRQCGPAGLTQTIDGIVYVQQSLEAKIRAELQKNNFLHRQKAKISFPQRTGRLSNSRIVIDPGHGGKDPGAISCLGFYEKTVNLKVAKELTALLGNKGCKVTLTRNRDVFLELEQRAALANSYNPNLFVSIHADSCDRKEANGFTVYVARSASRVSLKAARSIVKAMSKTGIKSRGVQRGNYRVLVKTNHPAVLVELGYLSNYWEARRLKDAGMQKRLAAALAEGITNYLIY